MVRGAVLQLAAMGEQNIVLSGNPQMSYFVAVYKRHTNFTYQEIINYFTGRTDFGMKFFCKINKIGDLLGELYLNVTLPDLDELNTDPANPVSWINAVGHAIIREYSIQIGENIIDRQYGIWLEIWSELNISNDDRDAYNNLVGKHNAFTNATQTGQLNLFIPLQFWFCRNPALALPLISIQRQDVILNIELEKCDQLITLNRVGFHKQLLNAVLYARYYFLDDSERKVFARRKHSYLIEQLQIQTLNKQSTTIELQMNIPFNHPVKELFWVVQRPDSINYTDPVTGIDHYNNVFNFSNVPDPTTSTGNNNTMLFSNFVIEGNDFFDDPRNMPSFYFRIVQPYNFHTRTPILRHIYLYSFAIDPEKHQPSGTFNFSVVDHRYIRFILNTDNFTSNSNNEYIINIFATNYNVLNVEHGAATVEFIT